MLSMMSFLSVYAVYAVLKVVNERQEQEMEVGFKFAGGIRYKKDLVD